MADKKWKCIGDCGKEFSFGEWECFPGVQHKVETKTYYLNDAPHCDFKLDPDGLAFRSSRNNVYVLPAKRVQDETGTRFVERGPLHFVMGRYETNDPEIQFFMERSKLDVGYDRWFAAYHTPTQKQNLKDGKLRERENDLAKKESELNELLAKAKQDVSERTKKEKATS